MKVVTSQSMLAAVVAFFIVLHLFLSLYVLYISIFVSSVQLLNFYLGVPYLLLPCKLPCKILVILYAFLVSYCIS